MTYIHITILAHFLTKTLNWKVLCGKDKYLLNSLNEKLKKGSFKINVNSKKSVSFKEKQRSNI